MDHSKTPGSATAYRRQKQIEECLYDNLLLRPYPSVSISDLCLQLGISRKSFYNYFPDKDSCFRAIINRRLQTSSLSLTKNMPEDAALDEIVSYYLTFWKSEKVLLDIIVRNNLLTLFMDQCIRYLREEDPDVLRFLNTDCLKTDDFVLAAFVSVHTTLLLQWYLQNFETPLEEMVRIYQRLIYQPLISLGDV